MMYTFLILLAYFLGVFIAAIVMLVRKAKKGINIRKDPWEYHPGSYGKESDAAPFIFICLLWPIVLTGLIGYFMGKLLYKAVVNIAWVFSGKEAKAKITAETLKKIGEEE